MAAFLSLLAIAFYVVVYTMLLKRSTPQNIVIGGAAGALPPVIGWAAVTGDISLPALLLFAIVFYWTPPHFWALALRIRGDYEAAGVPMLPVTHGVPRDDPPDRPVHRCSWWPSRWSSSRWRRWACSSWPARSCSAALFLAQAFAMAREGTDARAVRIYKYSITYLTALFALIILDVAVFVPLGVSAGARPARRGPRAGDRWRCPPWRWRPRRLPAHAGAAGRRRLSTSTRPPWDGSTASSC